MSGLDRIVEEIHKQARAESDTIIQKADEYSEAYMAEIKEKVQKEAEALNKKAQAERELYEAKIKSGMAFQERNAILQAKQQCIETCLQEAKAKIMHLSDEDYFALLKKILKANVQSGSGVMCLGAKDLDRLPESFEKDVQQIAEDIGGTLNLSKEAAKIENGFILVYGDIEENCTLKALFDDGADRLRDIVAKELFGAGAADNSSEVRDS